MDPAHRMRVCADALPLVVRLLIPGSRTAIEEPDAGLVLSEKMLRYPAIDSYTDLVTCSAENGCFRAVPDLPMSCPGDHSCKPSPRHQHAESGMPAATGRRCGGRWVQGPWATLISRGSTRCRRRRRAATAAMNGLRSRFGSCANWPRAIRRSGVMSMKLGEPRTRSGPKPSPRKSATRSADVLALRKPARFVLGDQPAERDQRRAVAGRPAKRISAGSDNTYCQRCALTSPPHNLSPGGGCRGDPEDCPRPRT
jgi:hypothetical protein